MAFVVTIFIAFLTGLIGLGYGYLFLKHSDVEIIAQAIPKSGIYNSALAFDCDDDIIPQLTNQILEANILATSDFDSTHPKGSPLNDLFEYRRVIKECAENGGEFEQCGDNQLEFPFNNNLVDIINNSFSNGDYYNSLDTRFTDLNLAILRTEPTTSETQFVLHLTFENGQVWSDTTELVIFN